MRYVDITRDVFISFSDPRQASPHLSPLAIPQGPAEGGPVSSGYAVTYRRTGGASVSMVSGGGGAQGTYRSLDPGAGANGDKLQVPSQGTPSRAERRAGMHISGPFSVTVPLHITSGLALGVLQGGRGEEEEPRQGQNEEEQLKKDKLENAEDKETELDEEKVQTDEKTGSLNDNKDKQMDHMSEIDGEKEDVKKEDIAPEVRLEEKEESGDKSKEDQCSSEEEISNEEQPATDRPSLSEDIDGDDYMGNRKNYAYRYNNVCLDEVQSIFTVPSVMKGGVMQCPGGDGSQNENLDLPSQEEEYPDNELPLDFQDTFGFLDLMDMPASNQVQN